VATSGKVVVLMNVSAKIYERSSLLSAYETIQTILGFGMFTIALISLIVNMLKKMIKKITVHFSRSAVISK
jgi:hypothetical protein